METILTFMGKDHDRLAQLFDKFKNLKYKSLIKAIPIFHDFKIGLQRHIVWEENILFPIFEDKTDMHEEGPTAVMRSEHREIKEFLERIHNKLIKGEINRFNELENNLFNTLKAHNEKEENILYPWIDNSTTEAERKKLFARMKSLPADMYNKCCE